MTFRFPYAWLVTGFAWEALHVTPTEKTMLGASVSSCWKIIIYPLDELAKKGIESHLIKDKGCAYPNTPFWYKKNQNCTFECSYWMVIVHPLRTRRSESHMSFDTDADWWHHICIFHQPMKSMRRRRQSSPLTPKLLETFFCWKCRKVRRSSISTLRKREGLVSLIDQFSATSPPKKYCVMHWILHEGKIRKSANQNAETISKKQHKRTVSWVNVCL